MSTWSLSHNLVRTCYWNMTKENVSIDQRWLNIFKDFQHGNITFPNRKKVYKLSLCPISRWRRVIAIIIYLLTVLLFWGWGFFVVGIVFFLINNFWKLDNLGQPLVIVKFCIRVHVKYSETCQEMLGKNWKE